MTTSTRPIEAHEVTVLVDQIERAYSGDAWHGPSVCEALDGIDAATAHARPIAAAHTIWEITLHLASWKHEVCRRVEGAAPQMPLEGDWPAPPEMPNDPAWGTARAVLDRAHRRLVSATRLLRVPRLRDMVGAHRDQPLGSGVSFEAMLLGSVQHDVYHAGQILVLRKAFAGPTAELLHGEN